MMITGVHCYPSSPGAPCRSVALAIFWVMPKAQPGYDIRKGSAAYAQIVGGFGALAVPTVVVVFTGWSVSPPQPLLRTLATELFVATMLGSLLGAFGFASIGAELKLTPNLVPATMLLAVPVAVAISSALGAFDVLAAVYERNSTGSFRAIVGVLGVFTVFFNAFGLVDSLVARPGPSVDYEDWAAKQWLRDRDQAMSEMWKITIAAAVPITALVLVRLKFSLVRPSQASVQGLFLFAMTLLVVGGALGLYRSAHRDDDDPSIHRREAYGASVAITAFTSALLIVLP